MTSLLLFTIIVVVTLILLFLKTKSLYVFFALCAGNVLLQFANRNMAYVNGHLNTHLLPHGYIVTKPTLEIAILILPPILVAIFAKHDKGITKWPVNVFPAFATGILGVLFITPLLSLSTQASITHNKSWNLLEQYQVPIVGLIIIVSVFYLILNSYSNGLKKHHKG